MQKLNKIGLVLMLAFGLAGGAAAAGLNADKSKLTLEALDMDRVAQEDAIGDIKGYGKYRFAVPHDVQINTAGYGRWEIRPDGMNVWTFEVETPDAAHLNFGFSPFFLPDGARLVIQSRQGLDKLGPYTAEQNLPSGQFWTPVLKGEAAIIELEVPANRMAELKFGIVRIGHGYRGFGATAKHCKAGACNTDVACLSAGDPWNNPRRSVAAFTTGGSDTCTGSLVNNTLSDKRMLFATATHCGIEQRHRRRHRGGLLELRIGRPAAVRVPRPAARSCRARPPPVQRRALPRPDGQSVLGFGAGRRPFGLHAAGIPAAGQSGLQPVLGRLGSPQSRSSLLRLRSIRPQTDGPVRIDPPPRRRREAHHLRRSHHVRPATSPAPPACTGIRSGIRRRRTCRTFPAGGTLTPSVTEPGSSGSPLYNANQRLIGVLSGGPSACGSTGANLSDFYGKLAHAWDGLGTPTTAVKSYLDPGGTNPDFIDGRGECTAPDRTDQRRRDRHGAEPDHGQLDRGRRHHHVSRLPLHRRLPGQQLHADRGSHLGHVLCRHHRVRRLDLQLQGQLARHRAAL